MPLLAPPSRALWVVPPMEVRDLGQSGWGARGIEVGTVEELMAAEEALDCFAPGLVVFFVRSAQPTALVTLARLRRDVRFSHLTFAACCPPGETATALESLRCGAVAVLLEPLHDQAEAADRLLQAETPPSAGRSFLAWMRAIGATGELSIPGRAFPGRALFESGRLLASEDGRIHRDETLTELVLDPQSRWVPESLGNAPTGPQPRVVALPTSAASPFAPPHAPPARHALIEEDEEGESTQPGLRAAVESTLRPVVQPLEEHLPTAIDSGPQRLTLPPLAALGSRPRALAVDDDPSLLRMLSVLLTHAGFEVATAADGLEGHALAAERRPDVVVADLEMPRLDGWGLLARMRADLRLLDVPVVFLSARDDYLEGLRALEAGARDHLRKGIGIQEIVRRVEAAVAPRLHAALRLRDRARVRSRIERLGPLWLLRELLSLPGSFTVSLGHGAVAAQLGVVDQRLVHAQLRAPGLQLEGGEALARVLLLQSGDVELRPGEAPDANLLPVDATQLDGLALAALNRAEEARLTALLDAPRVVVDSRAAALFVAQVGQGPAQPLLASLESGASPASLTPEHDPETLQLLRELFRRGVIRLH